MFILRHLNIRAFITFRLFISTNGGELQQNSGIRDSENLALKTIEIFFGFCIQCRKWKVSCSNVSQRNILHCVFFVVPLAAPNITLVNTSSTSIAMNWTALPWEFHNGILLGYSIWLSKEETGGTFTQTKQRFSANEFYKHSVNMSKWTNYCVRIAGYTAVGDGLQSAAPECTRTFEDGKSLFHCTLRDVFALVMG